MEEVKLVLKSCDLLKLVLKMRKLDEVKLWNGTDTYTVL
jgi:hypothetical protein